MERLHMNERIKELAGQCYHRYSEHNIDLEKFAELIVEEMYVFMCNSTDNDKPWPSFKEVKEHFGVEK